ncbi:hypothetical protein TMEC54S_03264 [Thauera mechernichensis]
MLFAAFGIQRVMSRLVPAFGLATHPIVRNAPPPGRAVVAGLTVAAALHLALPVLQLPADWHGLHAGILLCLTLGLLGDLLLLPARAKFVALACILSVAPVTANLTVFDVMRYWGDPQVRADLPASIALIALGAAGIQLFSFITRNNDAGGVVVTATLVALLICSRAADDTAAVTFITAALGTTTAVIACNRGPARRSPQRVAAPAALGDSGSLVLGFIVLWLAARLASRLFSGH